MSLLQIDFLELEGGNLGGFGDFIVLCHQVVELLVVKIHPAGVGFVAQGDGEGNDGNIVFPLRLHGDITGGIILVPLCSKI